MRKKPTVTKKTPAGDNHQVVTIEGGGGAYRKTPCEECPWRRENAGNFPAEAFRVSARTAYDMAGSMFACHMAGSEKPATCAAFLLNGSVHNLCFRMAAARGAINLELVSDGGADLFESYREMAEANGVDEDDSVLRPCR